MDSHTAIRIRMNPPKVRGKVNPKTAASTLKRASKLRPKLAIILGSGFNTLANEVKQDREISYQKLSGFLKPGSLEPPIPKVIEK